MRSLDFVHPHEWKTRASTLRSAPSLGHKNKYSSESTSSRAVGNDHFCDTTKRALQRPTPLYKEGSPLYHRRVWSPKYGETQPRPPPAPRLGGQAEETPQIVRHPLSWWFRLGICRFEPHFLLKPNRNLLSSNWLHW